MRGGSVLVLLFLLLMDCHRVFSAKPPRVPFLTLSQDGSTHLMFSNQTVQFSPQSFQSFEILCQSEDTGESVNYFWNMMDVPLSKADKEFEISNGTLRFLEPNYGMFECFASNSLGTSYSLIVLTKHQLDIQSPLKLIQGPEHLEVSKNSLVRYLCEAEAGEDVELKWTFNTKPVQTSRPDWKVEKLSSGKQSLLLPKVSEEDVGTVGCFVSTDTQKVYQEGSILLRADQTEDRMVAPDIQLGTRNEISILEGDTLNLNCESTGYPTPVVSWTLGSSNIQGNQLTIEDINSTVSGELTCQARNPAGTWDQTIQLKVYSRSSIEGNSEEFQEFLIGDEIRLECNYNVDEKWGTEVQVRWLKNGSSIDERNISLESSTGKSVLVAENSAESDLGQYSCKVETPLDTVSRVWTVQLVSPPTILSPESSKTVLQGTLTLIPCEVTGSPAPRINWFFNSTQLQEGSNLQFLENGGLRLDKVEPHQSGDYKCLAENPFGTDEKTFTLNIARPTTPLLGKLRNIYK